MSAPEGEPQGGRQTCWEPGCESVQGEEPGSYGEKQVCDKGSQQPVCEKGSQQPVCEKGSQQPVREKGSQQPVREKAGQQPPVHEKGSQQPVREKAGQQPPVHEKGSQQPVREKAGQQPPVHEKGSQQPVREKGGQQPVREKGGQQPLREKGEQDPACKKGEHEPVCEKGEKSVCEQKKASVSEEGEEGETDWKLKCETAWKLREDGIPTPENLDWKDIYHKKPFGRNLLKSSNPEGLSTNEPPPPAPADAPSPRMPLESYGNFSGWNVSTENLPVDRSGIPPGVVVCYLPNYSWCIKEQLIDLVSEGMWPELLDSFQPEILVLDWYEDSKLHQFVYELHVKLLGADKSTVIQEFSLKPEDSMSGDSTGWKHVSHIFKSYGPGVRYVHFMHKSKDLFVVGFHRTRLTNTSVFVKLRE